MAACVRCDSRANAVDFGLQVFNNTASAFLMERTTPGFAALPLGRSPTWRSPAWPLSHLAALPLGRSPTWPLSRLALSHSYFSRLYFSRLGPVRRCGGTAESCATRSAAAAQVPCDAGAARRGAARGGAEGAHAPTFPPKLIIGLCNVSPAAYNWPVQRFLRSL